MKKNNPLQKKLQEIFSQKKFEELEPFRNMKSWKALDQNDRSLLASLFVMLGEKQLAQQDNNAHENFNLASQVSPDNAEVFFRVGSAYAIDAIYFNYSAEAFKKCLQINPQHFRALISLGNIYNSMGIDTHDPQFFYEAQSCYNLADSITLNENKDLFHCNWNWAISLYCQSKESGEPVDLYNSLKKFSKAAEQGIQDKFFWNNYGDAVSEFACLVGRPDMYHQAIELYRNAVRLAFDYFVGWLNLGSVFQRLFEIHMSEEYYNQAYECFKMASQIDERDPSLWLKWAQLLAMEGKVRRNQALLKESFEKFANANRCDPHNALILGLWGEALLLCGSQMENIEMLHEAQQKIIQSLEINAESPETWYIYGSCLYELGYYFNQEDYYHQAIDKFQFGLSIKQNEPLLWYGLAIACYAIGEIRSDIQWVEKSISLFSRVLEFRGQGFRPLWNDWGIALMKMAEMTHEKSYIESAIEKFETIISKDPEQWDEEGIETEWLYNYGCALDFLGDFTEEMECYELAIQALACVVQMDPQYTTARYNLALSLAHLGDLARDVECFHKSIEQFQILLSQDNEDDLGWTDYGLTIMHLALLIHDPARPDQSQKLFEIAEGKFLQAAALGNTQTYYNLACLYSLQGNYSGALHYLDKAEAAEVLPSIEQLLHDEWLEGLRTFPGFRNFINYIAAKKTPRP